SMCCAARLSSWAMTSIMVIVWEGAGPAGAACGAACAADEVKPSFSKIVLRRPIAISFLLQHFEVALSALRFGEQQECRRKHYSLVLGLATRRIPKFRLGHLARKCV